MQITCKIGSEWHTTSFAKGFTFLIEEGQEIHIYKSSAQLVRKEPPELIGNKGKHGSWTQYQFKVKEGAILKFYSQSDKLKANGFFKVCPSAPLIKISGANYRDDGAWLEGQLEWLSPTEMYINPLEIASFDEQNLTIQYI
jgi:hypothetical protein